MLKNTLIKALGIILIVAGIILISTHFINDKISVAYDMFNQNWFPNQEINKKEEKVENVEINSENIDENTITENETEEDYYIGYLEIPRINFYRGFTSIDSSTNNISVNIEINAASNYPGVQGGNFIISAHSGTGYNAYFRYLYKLEEGDTAYVYYNGIKYIYLIDNIYNVPKVGTVNIYRDTSKQTLTLVTCTYNDESSQTVYIAYLDKAIEY